MKFKSLSCKSLQFHERNVTFYIRASYILFLFAKSELENNNFIKEIKQVLSAFIARLAKISAKFVRILEQVKLIFDCVSGFSSNSPKRSFHQAMKARKLFFIS